MSVVQDRAARLHKNVPADWYARSIRENFLQRYWHKRRFDEVGKMIEPAVGRVLDIGCADGTFTRVILERSRASRVFGIDVLRQSVSYAKRRFARSKRMSFRVADAHKLPYESSSFDAVFCLETLEHVEEPNSVIFEMRRVLKSSGYAVVLVPTENFLFRFIVWPLWTLWRGRVWKGTHIQSYSGGDIVSKLEKAGLKVKRERRFLLGMLQVVKVVKK